MTETTEQIKVIEFALHTSIPDLNAQLQGAKRSPYSYAEIAKQAKNDIAWEIRAHFSPGRVPVIKCGFAVCSVTVIIFN